MSRLPTACPFDAPPRCSSLPVRQAQGPEQCRVGSGPAARSTQAGGVPEKAQGALRATAARMSAWNAFSSIFPPS